MGVSGVSGVASNIVNRLKPLLIGLSLGERKYGFDAEQIQNVLPNIVRTTLKGDKAIAYQDIISLLCLAAKERQQMVTEHQRYEEMELNKIEQQEAVLKDMENELNTLRRRFSAIQRKF